MRRSLIATIAVLAATSPALAEPCEVTIARAPDDVRAQIEAWVRAEPRCALSLEVRVVPTDGGLYLFARDGRGYTRERLVPDGQTAGALVASWIADDSIDGAWVVEPHSLEQLLSMSARPPGMHAPLAPPVRRYAMTTGGFAGSANTTGARIELDLPLTARSTQATGGWFMTASLGVAGSRFHGSSSESLVHVTSREARAGLGLGHMWSGHGWQLRARVALMLRAMQKLEQEMLSSDPDGPWQSELDGSDDPAVLFGGEAAVLVSRQVGARWWIVGGPLLSKDVANDGLPDVTYEPELTVFAGVAYTP